MKVSCLYFEQPVHLTLVAEVFLRLSPQICFGKSALFIEIGKCHRLYSEEGFRARCQVLLKRLNLKARLAMGTDIAEAFVKAKYSTNEIHCLPLTTLTDLVDPFEKEEDLKKNVSSMIQAFQYLGVTTLGQFKNIPLPELVSRFGAIGILCMQRLRQEVEIPWPFWKPEEIICEKDDFPYFEFYGELEPILFKLKEQLDRIFQRLWGRQLWIQKLQVRVFFETNSVHPVAFRQFEFDFISPQSQTKATLNIIKERLAQDFEKNPVHTPIESLETQVLVAVPGKSKQKNLLNNQEEQLEQLNAVLGQLMEAHGASNIFFAELTQDRRPEKSWRKITSTNEKNKNFASPAAIDIAEKIPLRPTQLIHPPLKVQIQAGHIHILHKKFKISRWSEFVERLSGEWFEEPYERTYYHLELLDAPAISVFRDQDNAFYLQGYFG